MQFIAVNFMVTSARDEIPEKHIYINGGIHYGRSI